MRITNGGNIEPTKDEMVSFPGAYDSTDPGLMINIYYPKIDSYIIPGPPMYLGSGNATRLEQDVKPAQVEEGTESVGSSSDAEEDTKPAASTKNSASISKNTAPVKKVAQKSSSGKVGCSARSSRFRKRWGSS